MQEMAKRGVPASTAAYEKVIKAFAKAGQARAAVRYLQEMQSAGLEPTVRALNSVITAHAKRVAHYRLVTKIRPEQKHTNQGACRVREVAVARSGSEARSRSHLT